MALCWRQHWQGREGPFAFSANALRREDSSLSFLWQRRMWVTSFSGYDLHWGICHSEQGFLQCKKADFGYYRSVQCLKKKGIALKDSVYMAKAAVKAGCSVKYSMKSHFSLKSFTTTEELQPSEEEFYSSPTKALLLLGSKLCNLTSFIKTVYALIKLFTTFPYLSSYNWAFFAWKNDWTWWSLTKNPTQLYLVSIDWNSITVSWYSHNCPYGGHGLSVSEKWANLQWPHKWPLQNFKITDNPVVKWKCSFTFFAMGLLQETGRSEHLNTQATRKGKWGEVGQTSACRTDLPFFHPQTPDC